VLVSKGAKDAEVDFGCGVFQADSNLDFLRDSCDRCLFGPMREVAREATHHA
jgi:hypothetical protein